MTNLIPFDSLTSLEWLSSHLRCHPLDLIHSPKDFQFHKIPKKNKKNLHSFRYVWEVKNSTLANVLDVFHIEYYKFACFKIKDFPLTCTHGFINKRSILTNAIPHSGKKLLLKADISNFFDTITAKNLESHFFAMKIHPIIINTLVSLLTINGKLPQGFCTSPLLSNLVFIEIDRQLIELAKEYDCQFTRYGDDMTFSSDVRLPNWKEISDIVAIGGFTLNRSKYTKKKKGQACYVTGLSINDTQPRAPKKFKSLLRQELYFMEKLRVVKHAGTKNYPSVQSCVNKIAGRISFLNSIEPQKAKLLKAKFNKILERDDLKITYSSQYKPVSRNIFMYLDEMTLDDKLFLGLSVIEDELLIEQELKRFLREKEQDPFLSGKTKFRDSMHIHWNDFPIEVRNELVNTLKRLPVRAYIAYTDFKKIYTNEFYWLFEELLKKRYLAHDGDNVEIIVEENSAISSNKLQSISDNIYNTSTTKSSKRPKNKPMVKMVSKQSSLNCALSDCLLGVLSDYLSKKDELEATTIFQGNFERLRPKFRYIKYLSKNSFLNPFTSKNPISKNKFETLY